jgi:hypothetical protein
VRTLFASAANWARHRAYSRHISESMTAGSCTSTELFVSNFIFHGSAKVDGSLRQPSRQPGNLKRPPSSLSTSNAAGLPEIGRRCEATRDVGLWVGLYFCTFLYQKTCEPASFRFGSPVLQLRPMHHAGRQSRLHANGVGLGGSPLALMDLNLKFQRAISLGASKIFSGAGPYSGWQSAVTVGPGTCEAAICIMICAYTVLLAYI